jgi:hypothetical protein
MKLEFSRQIFRKYSYIKCHKNSSSDSRIVPCGRTDTQSDMTKLLVAFRNSANAPEDKTSSLPRPMRPSLGLSHGNSVCTATCKVPANTTVSMLTHLFFNRDMARRNETVTYKCNTLGNSTLNDYHYMI